MRHDRQRRRQRRTSGAIDQHRSLPEAVADRAPEEIACGRGDEEHRALRADLRIGKPATLERGHREERAGHRRDARQAVAGDEPPQPAILADERHDVVGPLA